LAVVHILKVNCAEITKNKRVLPVYCILALNVLFYYTLYTDCLNGRNDAVARHVSFAQIVSLNNSVKHWPMLTVFGTLHRKETWRKWL